MDGPPFVGFWDVVKRAWTKKSKALFYARKGSSPKVPPHLRRAFAVDPVNRVQHHFGRRLEAKLFLDAIAE